MFLLQQTLVNIMLAKYILTRFNIVLLISSISSIALGQEQATVRPTSNPQASQQASQPTGLGRGRTDTPLYFASSAAATRAIAICSGLWSGEQTMEDINLYSSVNEQYKNIFKTEVDEKQKTVSIQYDDSMPPRIVIWRPVLGCTQLPVGSTIDNHIKLPQVSKKLIVPNYDNESWPMGDRNAHMQLPKETQGKIDKLTEKGFDGKTYGGTTWGIIILSDGKIVSEKYALNFNLHKGAQTHSAAKSFAASLIGLGVKHYNFDLREKGILKAWNKAGDPRRNITAEHLLRMSSGLYGEGNGSPQADIYSNGTTVEGRAATNFLHTQPGKRFLYNPPDTMLLVRALREKINNDSAFWAMPFTELFWKIGMTRTVPSSDWNGDFLMSGQTYSTARDFARFGLLYLNKGKWLGEQILPRGWSDYVQTQGPVQPNGSGARYGAQFWLYGGISGLPNDAYSPAGGQGNYAMIIPSKDVVIVRRGYDGLSRFNIAQFSADVIAALGQ